MAATLGFPFTAAQWKELERQAMIYKYMVASVPVPYQLLLPIIQNLPTASHSPFTVVSQLRYSSKQDLEPGRCKRTDGKKWRCSRDVAPNQKYCERHMHRGRPRSRKHVELSKNPTNKTLPSPSSNPRKVVGSTILPSATESPLFLESNKRGSDWSTEGGSEQQWRQIMQTSRSIFNNDFGEQQPLDLQAFTDFGTSHDYLGSDETPRRDFIDAWSTDKSNVIKDSSVGSTGNLSPSALDLSMAMALGNNTIDNGFGLCDMEQREESTQVSSLLNPVSCGGPLAEVLRVGVCSNPTSPYPTGDGGNSISISPPPTTVSSPSGVLQRTMLSVSDGSACNSPTVAASSTPTDIVGFQWFT